MRESDVTIKKVGSGHEITDLKGNFILWVNGSKK